MSGASLLTLEPFIRHRAYTLWRVETHPSQPDKLIKVPVHYDGTTHHSAANPAPPLNAQEADGWLAHHRAVGTGHGSAGQAGYIGAGFRPDGTGLVCIDLDACITPEGWTPGAAAVLAMFPGALVEQSVSGRGAHIWVMVQGTGPGRLGKKATPLGEIEVYGSGQFIACGTVLGGDASTDHTDAVTRLAAKYWSPVATTDRAVAPVEWEAKPADEQARVLAELRSALAAGWDPDNRDDWQRAGHALSTLGDAGRVLWSEWSATSKRWPGGAGLDKWDTFKAERTDWRSVFAQAQRAGWSNPAARPALPGDAAAVFRAPAAVAEQLPAMVMERPGQPAELTFTAAAQGAIPATVERVIAALLSPEAGVVIARDDFFERILIDGRPLEDEDSTDLRARFERRGFKPVSADMMRDAIRFVARANRFDSAIDWARALAPWDGLKRIDTSMAVYYGAVDTPYTRAVGAYLFTALAGRCLVPGIKADMAPILIGLQGARKTSAVEALCPIPGAFGEIDLNKHDDALARLVRGKLVMELAELRGLSGRDSESTKAWLSRGVEEYRPVYRENLVKYPRRCVVIGTGNVSRILEDETGHRRYLPVHVGVVDLDALRRDRDQLWAEGLARFNAEGIAWQDAERLATAEHGAFEIVDEREALVAAWLAAPPPAIPGHPLNTTPRGAVPVRPIDVATEALNFTPAQFTGVAQKQIARIMRKLGYEPSKQRINGKPENVWMRTGT